MITLLGYNSVLYVPAFLLNVLVSDSGWALLLRTQGHVQVTLLDALQRHGYGRSLPGAIQIGTSLWQTFLFGRFAPHVKDG